tara:strand:- start:1109 stop:2125 length:1017 start_codon:yes stop_codon:yes gene_type:complete
MLASQKTKFSSNIISDLINHHYTPLMKEFYEMQCVFLSSRYQLHQSIETSNILISLAASTHLSIIRLRESNLDHDISLNNFFSNLKNLTENEKISHRIVTIVEKTGIPKETVRRKLNKLIQKEFVIANKYKEYYWSISLKRKENFLKIMKSDVKALSKFIFSITKYLNMNINQKIIEEEIEGQFSFYFYHYLNCQLGWLKMWQNKIKDVDLIFITMQVLIPTLEYFDKKINVKSLGLDNLHTLIGRTNHQYRFSDSTVNASSISEISGIPRATCIRKLDKLVKLGFLMREAKTKRYYVSQLTNERTKYITQKENVIYTIQSFSDFLSIVVNALIRNFR